VVYDSWTGNTERIAKAIAKGAGCQAIHIKENPPPPKILIIGSPIHFGPTLRIRKYLNSVRPEAMAIFFTYGAIGPLATCTIERTIKQMQIPGVPIIGVFKAKGFHPILLTHPGRPNITDIENAIAFGQQLRIAQASPGLSDVYMNRWVNQNIPFACGISQGIQKGMSPELYQKDPDNFCSSKTWYGRGFKVGEKVRGQFIVKL